MADDPNTNANITNVNTDDADLDEGNAEMTPAALDLQAGRAIPENYSIAEKNVWDNSVTQHDLFQQTTNSANNIGALGGAQFDLGGEGEMNTGALDNVDISLD